MDKNTLIKALLNKQPDVISEMTLLQFIGDQIGVVVDRSPKCHPELAGEGIEYAWDTAKLFYHRCHLRTKKTRRIQEFSYREHIKKRYVKN